MMSRLSSFRFASGAGLLLLAGAVYVHAQMSAPMVGWIAGQGTNRNQILPIVGVPGSATLREPLQLPNDVLHVHLAPAGSWALIEQRGHAPALMPISGTTAGALEPIAGVLTNPTQVSFSPTGKSAVMQFRTGAIQVVTGLDNSPALAFQAEFTDPSGIYALAVSDDGSAALAATGAGGVYLLAKAAAPVLAYSGSRSVGLAFVPNQSAAVFADGANGAVSLCRINGSPTVQTVANVSLSGNGVLVAASRDGGSAFLATVGSTTAYRIDLASGASQSATLPVAATRLDALRDGQSFVVSAAPGDPVWILTGNSSGMQTIFAANPGTPSPISRRSMGKGGSNRE